MTSFVGLIFYVAAVLPIFKAAWMPIIAQIFVLEVNQSKEQTLELMQKKKKAKKKTNRCEPRAIILILFFYKNTIEKEKKTKKRHVSQIRGGRNVFKRNLKLK